MAKSISELKESIYATYATYQEIREKQHADDENGVTDYDLIDKVFKLEGVFKRQIINFVKRYGTKWEWTGEEIAGYINFLRREECGWCWMFEVRDILKYAR